MLCPECGMQLLDEEQVCPSCGAPVVPEEETKVLFNGRRPEDAAETVVFPDAPANPDATREIGSEDPTMVRAPLDVPADPAAETEVLVFGGEYIFDDAEGTQQLGSYDPTAARGASDLGPAHVLPSEQGIVEMTPEEVIHAIEPEEPVPAPEPVPDAEADSAPDAAPVEILPEVPAEAPVEVEDATELLGSEFPTNVQAAFVEEERDPDKNLKMDIDPLASSGALDALGSLYDTGGMQFPVEGMEGGRREAGKRLHDQQQEEQSFGRRHRKGLIALVVVIVAAIVAAGAYLFLVVWPTHAVSDDEARQTLLNDDEFMKGRASDMYVASEPYEIAEFSVGERVADGDGLRIEATALLKNRFFTESDQVVLVYPDTDDASEYTLELASHNVTASRGISQDAEYGIFDANPTFDQAAQSCSLEQKRAEASGNRWWFTESGEIKLAYEFSNDSWKRTLADTSNLTSSFQHIVGTYTTGDTRLTSFQIRSVDNDTGTLSGTFTWQKESKGLFGSSEMEGKFTGTVHRDGTIEAVADDAPGMLAFTGSFGDGESLTISGTVYMDSALSALGFSDAPTVTFSNVKLVKGGDVEPAADGSDQQGASTADGQSSDAFGGTGDEGTENAQGDDLDAGASGETGEDTVELEPGFDDAPEIENAPWGPFSHRKSAFSWNDGR